MIRGFFSLLTLLSYSVSVSAVEIWVAPNGDDAHEGTVSAPLATITEAVKRAKNPGDIVTVRQGTYRGEKIQFAASGTPEAPITLQAQPGVLLKGSRVVPPNTWKQVPGTEQIYEAPWENYFGAYHKKYLIDDPAKWTGHRGDKARNQLFADGKILEEVPVKEWLDRGRCKFYSDKAVGRFYFDKPKKTLYVRLNDGTNPARRVVEATVQEGPIIASWGHSHLIIRGFQIEHLANGSQGNAAVRISEPFGPKRPPERTQSRFVTVENLSISWVSGTALSVGGRNHLVRNCLLNDNGQNALHVSGCHESRFEKITYLRNNKHPGKVFDHGWEAVMKVASSSKNLFDHLESGENHGMGWWVDGPNNHGNILQNSVIRDNFAEGVRIEIAYDTGVYNNIILRNREVGLNVSASIGNRIFNNTFYGNIGGAAGLGRVAKWRKEGYEMSSYANTFLNNIVLDNQGGRYNKSWMVEKNVKDVSTNLPESASGYVPPPFSENVSDNNVFYLSKENPNLGRDFFTAGGRTPDFKTYQTNTGLDANSVWGDPKFTDVSKHDFRLKQGSAAIGIGSDAVLPFTPKDRMGIQRPVGRVSAGAFQN